MRKFGIKLVAKPLGAIAISFLRGHHTYTNTPTTPSTGTLFKKRNTKKADTCQHRLFDLSLIARDNQLVWNIIKR